MAAPKGHKRYGGRQKGTPNKTTASVKAALVAAFDELGGTGNLVAWAKENPTEFFKLWAKLLPTEVKLDGPVQVEQVCEVVVTTREQADKVLALNT